MMMTTTNNHDIIQGKEKELVTIINGNDNVVLIFDPVMGYLHLSFEYHKGVLKVRVWQISDLLLPPRMYLPIQYTPVIRNLHTRNWQNFELQSNLP
jgi:hypothetical protein